ncbi:MAG: hypothetical protein GY862_16355, partial [Gammaproteobacteria bacterium]|nr:hypothetical protein [Gammaproteobacteria bacterium]
IRFRGALWGSGLLDFDVILAPFDVFVFRLADLDGDGQWEIDQSIDPDNFAYTSLTGSCHGAFPADNCMDQDEDYAPEPGILTQAYIDANHNFGYVEFIGEAVLDGMTWGRMRALLTAGSDLSNVYLSEAHRSGTGTGLGTNTWRWSTAGAVDNVPPYPDDRGLSDFPNIAGGTAFITMPGHSSGLAYNAEALADFRTPTIATGDPAADVSHRIDNYTRTVSSRTAVHPVTGFQASTASLDGAVILHHEDIAVQDARYAYLFNDATGDAGGVYEHMISWQNTRGPTMADGDDHHIAGSGGPSAGSDEYDIFYNVPNSIAEVEEAIRAGGQTFASLYFDDDTFFGKAGAEGNKETSPGAGAMKSWFFALFPTRHHAAAYPAISESCRELSNSAEFFDCNIYGLTSYRNRLIYAEGCDINADCDGFEGDESLPIKTNAVAIVLLSLELAFFDISYLKLLIFNYSFGGVRLSFSRSAIERWKGPGLFYTFEVTSDGKPAHWRRMLRGH